MLTREEKAGSKRGKQDPHRLSHQGIGSMHEAHRLEGKVKNVGIKNVGHQAKKPKA